MKKDVENKNSNFSRTSIGRCFPFILFFMTLFIKEQEGGFLLLFLDTNMMKRLVAHLGVMENTVKTFFTKKIMVDNLKKIKIFTPDYKRIKAINNIRDKILLEGIS